MQGVFQTVFTIDGRPRHRYELRKLYPEPGKDLLSSSSVPGGVLAAVPSILNLTPIHASKSTTTSGAIQTATFHDSLAGSGDVFLVVNFYYLYSNPKQLHFNQNPLQFTTGLTIDLGNCNVHVTVRAA